MKKRDFYFCGSLVWLFLFPWNSISLGAENSPEEISPPTIVKKESPKEEKKESPKEEKKKHPETWKDPTTGMEFMLVKGGCYPMGNLFDGGDQDEKPAHEVCVDDFYLGKYEVTQGEWKAVMGKKNPARFQNGDRYPVEQVSWNDTQDCIKKLNAQSDFNFRLPSEAEWEYAARERGKKIRFGNGKKVANPSEINFDGSEGHQTSYSVAGIYRGKTTEVGSFSPNELGLYDMSGNVWEWVEDLYRGSLYRERAKEAPIDSPIYRGKGFFRVVRGGSWNFTPFYLRVENRSYWRPSFRNRNVGFRLLRKP